MLKYHIVFFCIVDVLAVVVGIVVGGIAWAELRLVDYKVLFKSIAFGP